MNMKKEKKTIDQTLLDKNYTRPNPINYGGFKNRCKNCSQLDISHENDMENRC